MDISPNEDTVNYNASSTLIPPSTWDQSVRASSDWTTNTMFPADSGFNEMLNPFSIGDPQGFVPIQLIEAQEESCGEGKKRKKTEQKTENNETEEKGDNDNPSSSHRCDPPKEDCMHVRARRGQATNSHSLAERVRREKISERMKFLQDLVPGCSKVTGKAVMLDEIINYVQSLQRQVEFLSMKLATINPRLDFMNIQGLIAKDVNRGGLSNAVPFPAELTMPVHHSLIPTSLSPVCGGFTAPTSQVPSVWEEELHNVIHYSYNSSVPLDSHDLQDLSVDLPPSHMKAEP